MKQLTDGFKEYLKTAPTEARTYIPGEDLSGVSVSKEDINLLSQGYTEGHMIARDVSNHNDQWFINKTFFESHYVEKP